MGFRSSWVTIALVLLAPGLLVASTASSSASPGVSASEGAAFAGQVATLNPGCPVLSASASVNWGDGSSSAGTVVVSGAEVTVNGSHTYAEEGLLSGTVSGQYSCAAIAATSPVAFSVPFSTQVSDAPLQAGAVSLSASAAVPFSGQVATFSDANPAAQATDFRAEVEWGDSSVLAAVVQAAPGGGFTVFGSHTYADPGARTVSVNVRDLGGSGTTISGSVSVAAGNSGGQVRASITKPRRQGNGSALIGVQLPPGTLLRVAQAGKGPRLVDPLSARAGLGR